jgi:hypothetical protein
MSFFIFTHFLAKVEKQSLIDVYINSQYCSFPKHREFGIGHKYNTIVIFIALIMCKGLELGCFIDPSSEECMNILRKPFLITLICLVAAHISCQSRLDMEALRSEILDFHKKFIADHLNKNIESFVEDYSEDYVFVAHGEINHRTKAEFTTSFNDYLNSTTFSEYRDLEEPLIGFSKDGSMAWSIVKVKVAGAREIENGSTKEFDVTYAWITLYERRGEKWIRTVEVSTND